MDEEFVSNSRTIAQISPQSARMIGNNNKQTIKMSRNMKRYKFALAIATAGALTACAGTDQTVTRDRGAPLAFAPVTPIYDDTTSERASIDLLSLI